MSTEATRGPNGRSRADDERTHLEAALYARVAQLTAVAELGVRALRTPLPALLQACAAQVAETLGAELVMITERTADGAALCPVAGTGWRPGVLERERLETGARSLAGFTLESREPVISDAYPSDPRFAPVPFIVAHGARSGVAAVIEAAAETGVPFGALAVFSRKERAFTRDDGAFVQSVANVVAAAVEKDRTDARIRADLTFLADASHALSASLDVESTAAEIARFAVPRLADWCAVDVKGESGWKSVVWHSDPARRVIGERIRALVPRTATRGAPRSYRTGRIEYIPDVTAERIRELAGSAEALELVLRKTAPRSYLSIPLLTRGRAVGILTFGTEGDRRLSEEDARLAEELARHAALAIDNAWLYAESQRAVRDRDEVIGIVSHDLRSPLNGISLAAKALERRLADAPEPARRQIAVIHRSADRMARLIRDLLDMARIRAGKLSVTPTEVDACELLDEVLHFEGPAAEEKGIRLARGDAPGRGACLAVLDRDRVQQVLTNLIGNALKFTPPGGLVVAGIERAGANLRFTVADTGSGIATEHLGRIFDAYWTRAGGQRAAGAGLGLFISRGIVEAHGGRIGVESTPGAGATFWFELPARKA